MTLHSLRHLRSLSFSMSLEALRALGIGVAVGGGASLLAALPAPVHAQAFSFGSIRVEGNQRIATSTILEVAGIEAGVGYGGGEINEAGQRLRATGYFESVELIPDGSVLRIAVTERPVIRQIAIEGNRRLDDDDLSGLVASSPRRVFNPELAEQDAQRIAEAYASRGRLGATVRPQIIRQPDNTVDLVFEVFEGGVTEVERVAIVGNRSYSDRRLRGVLETKQAGPLRLIIQRDTYNPERLNFDRQLLTDFYRARGFIDFRVTAITPELTEDRGAFFITYEVEEGNRYRINEARAVTTLDGIDLARFQREIRIPSGTVYSPVVIDRTITRMERLAAREGLRFIRVVPEITRDNDNLLLNVDFKIERGPRIFVERIDIEGNTTTLDRVIRRQFDTVEGDPLNEREIRDSAARIRALGYFADVQVDTREGSGPNQRVVDVEVVEQPTGSLSFGANFSSDNGLGFVASLTERNFLGRGQQVGLSIQTGQNAREFSFNFTEPALLGRDVSGSLGLSYRLTDSEYSLFDTETFRFSPSLGFRIGENARLSLRYTLESADIFDVNTSTALINAEAEGNARLTHALGYTYSYDTRRTGLNPDAGWLFRFGQDFGVGDTQFVETSALIQAQARVLQGDLILRAALEGGHLHFPDSDSRLTDRHFLGSRTFRGFEPGGIGPREVNADDDDALGGLYFAVARMEAEFPIGLPEEYGITGGVFYDVGSVWGLDQSNADVVGEDFSLRQVAGVSLFWNTAIGPLRFNWSQPIDIEDFDRDRSFDLTISAGF